MCQKLWFIEGFTDIERGLKLLCLFARRLHVAMQKKLSDVRSRGFRSEYCCTTNQRQDDARESKCLEDAFDLQIFEY